MLCFKCVYLNSFFDYFVRSLIVMILTRIYFFNVCIFKNFNTRVGVKLERKVVIVSIFYEILVCIILIEYLI